MPSASSRARVWLLCAAALLGAYLCSGGLLRLNEVFVQTTVSQPSPSLSFASSSSSDGARPAAPDKRYGRLVVVLIDALRADMVLGSDVMYGREASMSAGETAAGAAAQELSAHMPYTRGLVADGDALGYIGHASVPTVTMPRLKALVTGKAPAFIDILKNFNSAALAEENLVALLAASGQRIVFYGDDTWLKLFPSVFQRADGTSGFFTRDTVQVDANVTRHLKDELDPVMQSAKSQDWDVLVLHYLGLDHVGHLRGPRSSMMVDKLHEMDAIVERVHESVKAQDVLRREQDASALPSLILLCSDHGMSEVGNHGGATVEESSALMMFLRGDGRKMRDATEPKYTQRRKQVDLVPTIAVLFGLRIPPYSTGLLLDEVIQASSGGNAELRGSRREYLHALYRNFQQLYQLAVVKFHVSSLVEFDAKYSAGIEKLGSFLGSAPSTRDGTAAAGGGGRGGGAELERLGVVIREACGVLQDTLAQSDGSEYNASMVFAGLSLLFSSAAVALRMLWHSTTRHHSHVKMDVVTTVLVVGSVLQVVSLTSSSSIENEHATAFYLLTTALFALGWQLLATRSSMTKISLSPSSTHSVSTNLLLLAVVLVTTRVLRSRNQVINFGRLNGLQVDLQLPGNEFAADDSLSILSTAPLFDGAIPSEAFFVLICALVGSKALLVFTKQRVRQQPVALLGLSLSSLSFTLGMLCSLLCCRMARIENESQAELHRNGGNAKLALMALAEQFAADDYARAVYAIAALLLVLLAVNRFARLLVAEMIIWLLVTLLQRENNLPTLGCLCIQLLCLSFLVRQSRSPHQAPVARNGLALGLLALWLAQSAFFALGNSHLVTTIDISQSFHGLSGYTQWLVGLLTAVSVFAGPLVVFVNLLAWLQSVPMSHTPELFPDGNDGDAEAWSTATDVCLALFVYQSLRFAVYTVVVYFMRFHLFIWSVFAPKMLYEVAQTGAVLVLILVASLLATDRSTSNTMAHTKTS